MGFLAKSQKTGPHGLKQLGIYPLVWARLAREISRPLKNALFCLISASGSDLNPQNTQSIPAVKIFAFLELKQN
ncbi:MAG: hypothetical protein DRH10_06145 [Deltaproteobacteria bacterium]|nr:MAG: hypothetical protein DRH10_06145 [Deltaproteobacteria bacterium]